MRIKSEPDPQKAKSLLNMASITLDRLRETPIDKYPSNTLTDYYDIIHKLMEALNFIDGIKFGGEGAHFNTINHVCNEYKLGEGITVFIQEMRDYRNRISYEGFNVKKNYIISNFNQIENLIEKLIVIVKKKLI
jgi:hypothetical protein